MNKEVYKHILRAYGHSPKQWAGFVAAIIQITIVRVYITIVMARVTTSLASGNIDAAKEGTLYFLIAYILGSLIGTLGELLSTQVENKQYGTLAVSFYKKLVGKDLSFYRDNQTGYLTSIFRQHLDGTLTFVRFFRGEALGAFISMIIPPIVLFIASPRIGMIALGVVLVQGIYVVWSSSKANKFRKLSHEIYRKITGEVSDTVTNIVAFKSGGVEDQAEMRMSALVKEETQTFGSRHRATTLYDLPRNIITACGIAAAMYSIITHYSSVNPESLGLIVLTLTYMYQIMRNVSSLSELVSTHNDLITKIYPTLRYLSDEYEEIRDPKNPTEALIKKGTITIDNISFSYPSHVHNGAQITVFKDLTINIKSGEKIGIVGLSGAGKSTLASLLLRFDDVTHGSIAIDGIDIRTIKQTDLRKNIAYVPQEPLLFHRSIRENIAYYTDTVTEAEIINAAKAAHAHEFIEKLPDGYNTIVGERGIKLSGGQKQRIAIARAVLKKAPIILFDEATSALDSESEQIIQRALPEIIGKQTAIVIAHRLSTIAGFGRIVVMHKGEVVEMGTHKELLQKQGRYYSLWQKQTSDFVKSFIG